MTDSPSPDTFPADSATGPPSPAQEQLLEHLRTVTVGEYDIYGELGRGGMATVYLAQDLALDRKVAIKVMSPALVYGPGLVERFKREARTAAHLSHPNIIPVYAVREAEGLLFFVMKVVEGTPLDSIMRELGKLPLSMVEAILGQVGGAFGYAHRHGVVHRDIKPSNILIDDEGWAVVTDFGIAKVEESAGLTQTGVAVGTPTYMSPEQCSGGPITGASDQYSLGVVAYEMLAGRPPFAAANMLALLYSHYHESAPPLQQFRPDCPEPMRAAVMRMLEKDPAARWPSMEDVIAAMGARQLAHDDPTRSQLISLARTGATQRIVSKVQTPRSPIPLTRKTIGSTPAPAGATPPRRRGWLIGGVAAVALAAAGVLILTRAPARSDSPAIPASGANVADSPPASPAPGPPPAPAAAELPPPRPAPTRRGGEPATLPLTHSEKKRTPIVDSLKSTVADPPKADTGAAVPVVTVPPAPAPAPVTTVKPATDTPLAALNPSRDRAAVETAIRDYAAALEAGNQAVTRRISMPPSMEQGWEAFWNKGGKLAPRWTVSDIVIEGDQATASIKGSILYTYSTPRDRPTDQPISFHARLERRGTGWRLVSLDFAK
jgi:serine/threonine-protein kinase